MPNFYSLVWLEKGLYVFYHQYRGHIREEGALSLSHTTDCVVCRFSFCTPQHCRCDCCLLWKAVASTRSALAAFDTFFNICWKVPNIQSPQKSAEKNQAGLDVNDKSSVGCDCCQGKIFFSKKYFTFLKHWKFKKMKFWIEKNWNMACSTGFYSLTLKRLSNA